MVTNTKGGPTDDGAVVTTSGRETGQPGTGTGNSAGTDQSVGNSAANSGGTAQPSRIVNRATGAVRTGDASGLMPAAAGLAASAAALTVLVRARKRR